MRGEWIHTSLTFQTSVKTSSVHMTFHFGFISKQPEILMDMHRILLAPYLFTNIAVLFSQLK